MLPVYITLSPVGGRTHYSKARQFTCEGMTVCVCLHVLTDMDKKVLYRWRGQHRPKRSRDGGGQEEIRESVHFEEAVFVQLWPLRQFRAGLRPDSDGPFGPETQDGCADREVCYTISLLTECGERDLGQRF